MDKRLKNKKGVSRIIAMTLGIICIILGGVLSGSIYNYTSILADKDIQISSLKNQVSALKAPKLVAENLKIHDVQSPSEKPYLHISGYVYNLGEETSYDSRLHVVACINGGVIVKEIDILLGTISGKSYTHVDTKVNYDGGPIEYCEITLYWQGGRTQYDITIPPVTTTNGTTTTTVTLTVKTTTFTEITMTTTVAEIYTLSITRTVDATTTITNTTIIPITVSTTTTRTATETTTKIYTTSTTTTAVVTTTTTVIATVTVTTTTVTTVTITSTTSA